MTRPNLIKSLLESYGLRPQRRFGQNFLVDSRKMDLVVESAGIQTGDIVLEVGPGTGLLTQRLVEAGARVVAVEIDRELEPILQSQLGAFGDRVRLIMGDALDGKHSLNAQMLAAVRANMDVTRSGTAASEFIGSAATSFKLVANLPYNIASPLIANLVCDHHEMSLAVVMIQREVAARLTADPGTGDYGPLGVIVQAMCEVKRIAIVPPGCFWPTPKVDSAILRLARRKTPLTDDPNALSTLLQKLFGQRRKQLGSILGRNRIWPTGIDPSSRPEQLTVEQLIELARCDC